MNDSQQTASMAMPQYQSHKKVWALKIKSFEAWYPTIEELNEVLEGVDVPSMGGVITPEDERYGPINVSREYVLKHTPQAGGYYVVYSDGYQSWSPADAFESGYTLVK